MPTSTEVGPAVAEFDWIPFYEELATKLVGYRDRQDELLAFLRELKEEGLPTPRLDDYDSETERRPVPLEVMDPFTFFGCFNRGIRVDNRLKIIERLKSRFEIRADVPMAFSGLPVLDNRNSWFFPWQYGRKPDDMSNLWNLFESAVRPDPMNSPTLRESFNLCAARPGLRFKITMGLFWIRPNQFLSMDGVNRKYLKLKLPSDRLTFDKYEALLAQIRKDRPETFPEISYAAWKSDSEVASLSVTEPAQQLKQSVRIAYDISHAKEEGLFLPADKISLALERLGERQNLILQGAPGVGKTFFAQKLAYMFLEEKSDKRVTMVQFHPSYSYEDFVRGYRPATTDGQGQFVLKDGPFTQLCAEAASDEDNDYVLIIDEINRANLSQVFGESFMLLEADKRGYPVTPMYGNAGETFVVPKNIYVIGTMNTADRSLALVDFALRRRFAFVTLEPCFDQPAFADWLTSGGMAPDLVSLICERMNSVNAMISNDTQLGPGYCIGHSFFCPRRLGNDFSDRDPLWYQNVVKAEIIPVLSEYWYEDRSKLDKARALLERL